MRASLDAQIPYAPNMEALRGPFFQPPLAWRKLESAVAYINSNCGALNGRNDVVQKLMDLNRLPVHAWGACLRNKVVSGLRLWWGACVGACEQSMSKCIASALHSACGKARG